MDYILNALSTKHISDSKFSQNNQHQNDLYKKHLLDAPYQTEDYCYAKTNVVTSSSLPIPSVEKNMPPVKKGQVISTEKIGEFVGRLQNPSSFIQVCKIISFFY